MRRYSQRKSKKRAQERNKTGLKDYQSKSTDSPEDRFYSHLQTKSLRTQDIYTKQIEELCKSPQFNASINEIVELHREDIEKGDGDTCKKAFIAWQKWAMSDQRKVIKRLGRDFVEVTQPLSFYTSQGYAKALNCAFLSNKLSPIKFNKYPKNNPKAKDLITIDQIRETVKRAPNLEARALLLTLKDSGLRISDICLLRAEDFIGAKILKDPLGREFRTWNIETVKTGAVSNVVLGYESVQAIFDTLDGRTEGRIFKVNANNLSKRIRGYTAFMKKNGVHLSAHSFRKTYVTRMLNSGISEIAIKMLVGKTVPRDMETYALIQSELLPNYAKVYDKALALDVSVGVEAVKEVQIEQSETIALLNRKIADQEALMQELRRAVLSIAKEGIINPTMYTEEEAKELREMDEALEKSKTQ